MKLIYNMICTFFGGALLLAQEVPQQDILTLDELNDITNVNEEFENAFYDALSNRLIDEPEKAIASIEKCLQIDDSKPILFYEKAKNYFEMKSYDLAQNNLEIALEKMPKNEVILKDLQNIYFVQQKYDKTISTLRELVEINPKYKKSLAQAYMYNEQYGKSLDLLTSYESAFGYDISVNKLRNQIYSISKDKTDVIIHLEKALDKNPNNENAYVKLIEVYKGLNKYEEASKVLIRFKKQMPDSPSMDYLTFRDYLHDNNTVKATEIMKKLTSNNEISDTLKSKVLDDYRTYGKQNPNFTKDLNGMESSPLSEEQNIKFFMELSAFQLAQGSTESLLKVYEENLNIDSNNYNLIKDTLPLLLYYGKTKKAKKLVTSALEKYPDQPFLYLINGHLLAKEATHDKAIISYRDGLDYLVDNPEYERALYFKMAASYEALGDLENAKKYQLKGEKISIESE